MEGASFPGSTLIIVLGSIVVFLGAVVAMLHARIPDSENKEKIIKELDYPVDNK